VEAALKLASEEVVPVAYAQAERHDAVVLDHECMLRVMEDPPSYDV